MSADASCFPNVSGGHNGFDVSTHAEITDHFDFPGIKELNQIIQNHIGDVFVKNSAIAKLIDVKLEAFQFDAILPRHVFDVKGGEIGKTGSRTDAGEFRAGELNRIAPYLGPVFKAHEPGFANHPRAVRPQRGEGDRLFLFCHAAVYQTAGFFARCETGILNRPRNAPGRAGCCRRLRLFRLNGRWDQLDHLRTLRGPWNWFPAHRAFGRPSVLQNGSSFCSCIR